MINTPIKIAIVDEQDNPIGAAFRKDAVENGFIHRIVRVFVLNSKGELFLQKRISRAGKIGDGKWDQSAGGHVDAGEDYETAAHRETEEEIGLTDLSLNEIATYYQETERSSDQERFLLKRFNRIFRTTTDQEPRCNPEEVETGKWTSFEELDGWVSKSPDDFTRGFLFALNVFKEKAHA